MNAFMNLPVKKTTWELSASLIHTPVMNPEGPVFPIMALAAPLAGEEVPMPHVTADRNVSLTHTAWQCLLGAAEQQGYRPSELQISTALEAATFKPLGSHGMKLRQVSQLSEKVQGFYDGASEFFGR